MPRTYNKNLSIVTDFLKFQRGRGRMDRDPTEAIERAKSRAVYRTTPSRPVSAARSSPASPSCAIASRCVCCSTTGCARARCRRSSSSTSTTRASASRSSRRAPTSATSRSRTRRSGTTSSATSSTPRSSRHTSRWPTGRQPVELAAVPGPADGGPRDAQVVVRVPRACRRRRRGHDGRRAHAQGASHRRPARARRDGQPQGRAEAARPPSISTAGDATRTGISTSSPQPSPMFSAKTRRTHDLESSPAPFAKGLQTRGL